MRISEFFYFQRSDRKVLLVLLLLTGVVMALFFFFGKSGNTSAATSADSLSAAGSGMGYFHNSYAYDNSAPRPVSYYSAGKRVERFAFDPNTADSTQFLRLGLRPWQVRNIYKYRARGGVYRKKEDFARLYGLDTKTYKELEPYIQISSDYHPASTLIADRQEQHGHDSVTEFPKKLNVGETVPLNDADTTLLQRIPGIGSYWSQRIVSYRKQLGGFHSKEQLKDLNGFPADALSYMHVDDVSLEKINVNTATLQQLSRHPYINFHRARAIIDFRRLRGKISSLDELKMSKDFTPEIIERLEPYVVY